MLILSPSLNAMLCVSLLPFCPIPHSILPVEISHKYSADSMKDYHCNKLIERKQMFYLGIAHNTICVTTTKIT